MAETENGAREWLIQGGNGFEGGEDGIRAHSCNGAALVEYLDEYGAYVRKRIVQAAAEIARHFANDELTPEEWPTFGLIKREFRCDGGFASLMADRLEAAIRKLAES